MEQCLTLQDIEELGLFGRGDSFAIHWCWNAMLWISRREEKIQGKEDV